MALWTWNLKDHLRNLFEAESLDPQLVEDAANASRALCVLSDLRNRDEHGRLEHRGKPRSRSGLFATWGKVCMVAPANALQVIIHDPECGLILRFARPELVEYLAPVHAQDGTYLGDAVSFCDEGISAWSELVAGHGLGELMNLPER